MHRPDGGNRFSAQEVGLIVLYLGLGAASALLWYRIITYKLHFLPYLQLPPDVRVPLLEDWHREMITGNAPSPNQYRALTPWLVQYLVLPLGLSATIYDAYAIVRAVFTGLTLLFFDRYLRAWFSRSAAAAGALCLAAVIPFTYYAVFQESDPLNLLVLVLAFLALTRNRDVWLIPLVLVGTLNRETTLLIPAVYALARWGEEPPRKVIRHTALLTLCWVVVFGGLHYLYGHRPAYTDAIMWERNLRSPTPTLYACLLFGVLWVLPWLAPKDAPLLLRRTRWLIPPFVAFHYVVAVVQEVRLFLPLAPIIIPLSWWVLLPETIKEPARRAPPKSRRSASG